MTSYKSGIRRRTCRLLVTAEDRNLIDLYLFKHIKCAGVKRLQTEHLSFSFTKFDNISHNTKGLHLSDMEFLIFSWSFKQPYSP